MIYNVNANPINEKLSCIKIGSCANEFVCWVSHDYLFLWRKN